MLSRTLFRAEVTDADCSALFSGPLVLDTSVMGEMGRFRSWLDVEGATGDKLLVNPLGVGKLCLLELGVRREEAFLMVWAAVLLRSPPVSSSAEGLFLFSNKKSGVWTFAEGNLRKSLVE